MSQLQSFFNYSAEGVIYAAQCPSFCLYIGKTICHFRQRVFEHTNDITLKRERELWNRKKCKKDTVTNYLIKNLGS